MLASDVLEVGIDHHVHEIAEWCFGFPAEDGPRMSCIADKEVNFSRTEESLVDDDMVFPIEAHSGECNFAEFTHGVGFVG